MTKWIIGVDEVGLGSWAGPLVVGAALVEEGWTLPCLKDSKAFTGKNAEWNREKAAREIAGSGIQIILEWRPSDEIDRIGLGRAHREAMEAAARKALAVQPGAEVIVDGLVKLSGVKHRSEPKADTKYPAVMAAAIVAKVRRDEFMRTYADQLWPDYDFASNKGYHSPAHVEGLDTCGICPIHRKSYAPIAKRIQAEKVRTDANRIIAPYDYSPEVSIEDDISLY